MSPRNSATGEENPDNYVAAKRPNNPLDHLDGSKALLARAQKVIPGGVNSPVRAFKSVGGVPPFIACAKGSSLWDVDGNEYIDYVGSWGPMIAGHAHDEVNEAILLALENGTSFGAPTEAEVLFAEKIAGALPSMQKLRLVSSGTEATMAAVRLARGATRRDRIVKIDGGYHGHADAFLVAAGSGVATLGIPGSAGVPEAVARETIVVAWNDLEAMRQALAGREVAAVIVEPVCGNMGCIPPREGYLEGLRALTAETGTILIFDEVMTGFRVAYGGKAELMSLIAPDGPVYQAGTLSGNPLAVAAGLKLLEILERPGTYEQLETTSATLCDGIAAAAREAGIPLFGTRVASMFTGFFTDGEVIDYATAKHSDTKRFARFHQEMMTRGVYLAPSQFEAGFVSLAHDDRAIARTIEAARDSMKALTS